jgi:PAS domain S-box-containing protein
MYSILYVDDDENLLGLNKIFLEKSGEFQVDTVSSAPEALDRIAAIRYDAILSDYQMPEMDGIEFLKLVRTRHGDLPFILFTGRGREDVVIDAVNNGVDYYIQKGPDLKAMIAELRYKILRAVERRQIQSDLKKSREDLNDIINFLPDALCVIDTEGKVIAWNQAMETITGISKNEMIGRGGYAYAVPFYGEPRPILMDCLLRDQKTMEIKYPDVENTGGKTSLEVFLPHLNGGNGAWIWACASLLYDSLGNVTGAIETVRDMTEVQKIRHDLSISREMNQGFTNMIPVAVYEMDLSGTLTFANKLALSWFGLTQQDFDHKICILDYIVQEDRDRAFSDIHRKMAGEKGVGQEYLLRRKDGSTFPGLIYGGTVTDPDTGKVTGLRGIIIDQTLRRAEAQALLESQERLKLALQAGDIGIWDVDMRTMIIRDIHEWASRTLDFPIHDSPDVTVNTAKSLVHLLDLPRILYAFFRHLANKTPLFEAEFRLRHRDRSWVWVAARGKVIERDMENRPVRITGTINTVAKPAESRGNCPPGSKPDDYAHHTG